MEEKLFIYDLGGEFLAIDLMALRKGFQPNRNAGKMPGEESHHIPLARLNLLLCEKSVGLL